MGRLVYVREVLQPLSHPTWYILILMLQYRIAKPSHDSLALPLEVTSVVVHVVADMAAVAAVTEAVVEEVAVA